MIEILLVLIMTSLSCSLLGTFIVLRNISMTTDALAHSIFLGIVIAFSFVNDLHSIYLIIGAALFGLLTVFFVEVISKNKLAKKSDALGLVYPFFFAIAIILTTKYFKNVNLDMDAIIMGNPIFTPFTRVFNMPKTLFVMSIIFFINALFVILFYKKLEIATFDEKFARLKGIRVNLLFYALMSLVSLTTVTAFESVGAVLVISFFVTSSATAHIISKTLKQMILTSMVIGATNSVIGFYIAVYFNVSITGMCSLVSMIMCILVIFVNKIKREKLI